MPSQPELTISLWDDRSLKRRIRWRRRAKSSPRWNPAEDKALRSAHSVFRDRFPKSVSRISLRRRSNQGGAFFDNSTLSGVSTKLAQKFEKRRAQISLCQRAWKWCTGL